MKTTLAFVGAVLAFSVVFSLVLFMGEAHYGITDPGEMTFTNVGKELAAGSILALCTAVGIFSKHMYDFLTRTSRSEPADTFGTLLKSIALAVILSPIVVISFLDELKQFSSPLFAMVFAYQNGFFFQTILRQGRTKR